MKPRHVDFGKSIIKGGHIRVLTNNQYISNADLVRLGGENTTPMLREEDVVIFQSFLKVGLWFLLLKMVVGVLKRFNIYLHHLTPNAIMRLMVFIWAVQSEGIEPMQNASIRSMSYTIKRRQLGWITFTTTLDVIFLLIERKHNVIQLQEIQSLVSYMYLVHLVSSILIFILLISFTFFLHSVYRLKSLMIYLTPI